MMQQVTAPPHSSGATATTISPPVSTTASKDVKTRYVRLAAVPASVPWARRVLRHMLREWHLEALSDSARLAVSELVTNAVQGTPDRAQQRSGQNVTLALQHSGATLRIEVWDASPEVPVLQEADITGDRGRGLLLVDFLSDAWGHQPADGGKIVWCELTNPPG